MEKEIVENVIKETIKILNCSYKANKESIENNTDCTHTKMVIPSYRNGEPRISEQELRFAFIEALYNVCNPNILYSIETPTKDTYQFSKDGNKFDFPQAGQGGRSGEIDLVLYEKKGNSFHRACIIEFKANSKSEYEFKKDFLKLHNPEEGNEDVHRYFIVIYKSKDSKVICELSRIISENWDKCHNNCEKYQQCIPVNLRGICLSTTKDLFEQYPFEKDGLVCKK